MILMRSSAQDLWGGDRAVLFHAMRELFWTYLFGWQNVAWACSSSSCRVLPGGDRRAQAHYPQLVVRDVRSSRGAPNERAARGPRVSKYYGGVIAMRR